MWNYINSSEILALSTLLVTKYETRFATLLNSPAAILFRTARRVSSILI